MNLYASMDALLREMEDFVREHYGYDSASWRSGDFAAGALLEFKARHGDGRVDHWTVGDVGEFLLDWFPRTVYSDEDLQRDVPDCVAVFFRFLAARGSLTGDSLSELEAQCARLREDFLSSCRDPTLWDPAKVRLNRIIGSPPADSDEAHPSRHHSAGEPRRRSSSAWRAAPTEARPPAARRTSPG